MLAQFFLFFFCDRDRHPGLLKLEKWSFLSICGRCIAFPQYFGQFQSQIILYLIRMKKVCFIFLCLKLLFFFWDRRRHWRVLRLKKMVNSKYFFVVYVFFPKFFRQVKGWLIFKIHGIIRVLPIFAFPVVFIFLFNLGRYGGMLEHMKNG